MPNLIKPDKRFGDLQTVTRLCRQERDARLSQRLHAIRLLMSGEAQGETARVLAVSSATIREWTVRWNQAGLEGLRPRHQGSHSRMTPGIELDIREVIEVQHVIDGRVVTGRLIHGYLKKNTS
jgi:transposase